MSCAKAGVSTVQSEPKSWPHTQETQYTLVADLTSRVSGNACASQWLALL